MAEINFMGAKAPINFLEAVARLRSTRPGSPESVEVTYADQQNIKRMIWCITNGFRNSESAWVQGIWFYLRRRLKVPSPHPFRVGQLPMLADELKHMATIANQIQKIMDDIEAQAIKRIFRNGEEPNVVVEDLKRLAAERMINVVDCEKLPDHINLDLQNVVNRQQGFYGGDYGVDEDAGYADRCLK